MNIWTKEIGKLHFSWDKGRWWINFSCEWLDEEKIFDLMKQGKINEYRFPFAFTFGCGLNHPLINMLAQSNYFNLGLGFNLKETQRIPGIYLRWNYKKALK